MTTALLDHLWQSTLFAAAIWLVMPLFRGNSATLRFWLWFAASVKFLVPFSIFAMAGRHLLPPVAPVVGPELVSALRPIAVPFLPAAHALVSPVPPLLTLLSLVPVVWLLGTIVVLARWFLRSLQLNAHLREANELPLAAPVPVKSTRSSLEPGLLGIWRPVVLLPDRIMESLSIMEMQAVMAHELCHLRRRDNLLAAVHMLVQSLFWFHPLVWWLGIRLVEERELACDEAVLASGHQPLVYAQGILKVCRKYVPSPLSCASGASGAALETRIGAILENRPIHDVGEAKSMLLLSGAALAVMLPLLAGGMATNPVAHIAGRVVSTIVAQAVPLSFVAAPKASKTEHKPAAYRRRHVAAVLPVIPVRVVVAPVAMVSAETKVVAPVPAVAMPEPNSRPAFVDAPVAVVALQDDATAVVCRSPQQLPGSHFRGPRVCRSEGEWAALRQQGKDIDADGHSIVEVAGGGNRPDSQACIPTFRPTYSNTGILCF
jgi:beta-lactamase regulating signal transducer with metallopeptidase domain